MDDLNNLRTITTREAAATETFVMLADSLAGDYDIVEALNRVVRTCVSIMEVDAAGMLLDDPRGGLSLVAASGDDVQMLEVFQVQKLEGPCCDCVRTGEVVQTADLRRDHERWPEFAAVAARAGFSSLTCLPLRLRSDTVGALGLFCREAGALPEEDRNLARAFADVATIGLLNQRSLQRSAAVAEQLRAALDSRVVIEQAKGVLAERGGLSMTEAYEQLRSHARHHNLKLTQVAVSVVQGDLRLPR